MQASPAAPPPAPGGGGGDVDFAEHEVAVRGTAGAFAGEGVVGQGVEVSLPHAVRLSRKLQLMGHAQEPGLLEFETDTAVMTRAVAQAVKNPIKSIKNT
jgi:hypothetical protein